MTGEVFIWWARVWNVFSQSPQPGPLACLVWPGSRDFGLLLFKVSFFTAGKEGLLGQRFRTRAGRTSGTFPSTTVSWLARLFQITAYTPIKQGCHTRPWTPFSVPTLPPPVTQSCCALHKRPGTRGFHHLTPLFTFAEWDSIRSQHRGHVAMALRARLASPL